MSKLEKLLAAKQEIDHDSSMVRIAACVPCAFGR